MHSVNVNENIAEIFRATRKFYGLNQTEMANVLTVSQGTISKIESGNMQPELGLWFKFIKLFNITDPYCFSYKGVEFAKNAFDGLKIKGSSLLPSLDYSFGNNVFSVRKIRPIIDFLKANHSKTFDRFLTKNKIAPELFCILNHPLTLELIDIFFSYLSEIKINEKSFGLMDLNFTSSLHGNITNNPVASSAEEAFEFLNDQDDLFSEYFLKEKNDEYIVRLDKEMTSKVKKFSNCNLILNYNLLYPYHYLKTIKKIKVKNPIIKETKKGHEWLVTYAA